MVQKLNGVQADTGGKRIIPAGLNSGQKVNVKRLYLAGLDSRAIALALNVSLFSVRREVKRLAVESGGLDVFAFKSVLSVRLCGILDRHEAAVSGLASESVRISGAIAAIDSGLADLGISPDKSALLLQVKTDKSGVPSESCRIAAACRAILRRPDLLSGAIALAQARADLVGQASRIAGAMLKADQSLADSLGKVGVAAIRAAGENTGPTLSPANNKNAKLSPPVDFKDDELVDAQIIESQSRYEEYLRNKEGVSRETSAVVEGDTDG